MGNNRIYAVLIIAAVILASGIGWSLGSKSTSNNVPNNVHKNPISSTDSASSDELSFDTKNPKDIISLRLPTQSTSFHLGAEVTADRYGFYKEEGLKIEYVRLPDTGTATLAALKAGQIDMFSGHPDAFINAVKGGLKVKAVIAPRAGHPDFPHDEAWVLKDSPIKEPKDVIGKKVGGLYGNWNIGCMAFFWHQYFKKYGIPEDQVIPTNIPPQQQEQAIKQGLIDIMTVHPPQTGVVARSGDYRRLWSSWDITNGDVIDKQEAEISIRGFTEEFSKKNPEAVRRFIRASIKAQAFELDNHELHSDWIQEKIGWSPKVREGGDHHYRATGLIRESALQKWIDWYVDVGLLKPGEIKPSDLYTNEFNPYNKYKVNDPVKDPTYWDTLPSEYFYVVVKKNASTTPSK